MVAVAEGRIAHKLFGLEDFEIEFNNTRIAPIDGFENRPFVSCGGGYRYALSPFSLVDCELSWPQLDNSWKIFGSPSVELSFPASLLKSPSGRMVYITEWDKFVERSIEMFRADPDSTRYVMKYRHCDGKLVLKVTDNRECLKYKTDQAQEARKMEKLNNIFFALMARGPDVDISEVTGKEQMDDQPAKKGRGRKQ
ncbi:hypothetical protein RJT34_16053 [Clitoria ternatea]|uniref:Signal recognition particle 9 kDa protein n=1 Tax=Clitoria ternatea TaxID=43366 RepID=A0AAN9J6I5_CLITE